MSDYIFTDLNVRVNEVNPSDVTIITDSQAIKQALVKLINTQQGSIPYYRSYGVNIKQYLHYPLNESTGKEVYNHVRGQIDTFIQMVTIMDGLSSIEIDYSNSAIKIHIVVRNDKTGEIISTEPLAVPVGK